jgi:4-oxalomesaconate tautomerase
MLAAVLPFAIEAGLWPATDPVTSARIFLQNTGGICEVTVQTPGGHVMYAGTAQVDGVPGTGAPIICYYLDTVGATCGALLPAGQEQTDISGIQVTCLDNGMPLVIMRAADLGISGYEPVAELDNHLPLRTRLEEIRLEAGLRMGLGDVSRQTIPKLCLLAPPRPGEVVHTRMFIPHVCHEAIGVLAAISVATACSLPGSIAAGIAQLPTDHAYAIGHPSGQMTIQLAPSDGQENTYRAGVVRTARLLSRGEVMIPDGVWAG